MTAIAVSPFHTVGLRPDGTAIASGDVQYGQCDLESWTDLLAIAAGERHTLGVRKNGSVIAAGDDSAGQCQVTDWTLFDPRDQEV